MGTSVFGRFHRLSETLDGKYELDDTLEEESSIEPHVMNEEEIMHKYWKIAVFYSLIKSCTWILIYHQEIKKRLFYTIYYYIDIGKAYVTGVSAVDGHNDCIHNVLVSTAYCKMADKNTYHIWSSLIHISTSYATTLSLCIC